MEAFLVTVMTPTIIALGYHQSVNDAVRMGAAMLIGLMVGAFSTFGDPIGVMVINGLANAASPWVVTAFFAGALQRGPRRAVAGGVAAMVAGVVMYYIGALLEGHTHLLFQFVVWTAAAVVSGCLFGLAGITWRMRSDLWRPIAVAAVSGTLLAEAAHRFILVEIWTGWEWEITYVQVAVANIVMAGLLLLVLLERRHWLPALGWLALVTGAALLVLLTAYALLWGW